MKSRKKKGQKTRPSSESSVGEAGKTLNPKDLPEEVIPPGPVQYNEVAIGKPVSEENYQKMKDAAETSKLPPTGNAQEDCVT